MNDLNFAGKGFAHHLASVELDVPQSCWFGGFDFLLFLGMFLQERSRLRCSSTMTTRPCTLRRSKTYHIKMRQKLATVPSILGGVTIPNQPRYKVVASTALASIWRRCNAKVGNGLLNSSLAEVFLRRTRRYAVLLFCVWWVLGPLLCHFAIFCRCFGWLVVCAIDGWFLLSCVCFVNRRLFQLLSDALNCQLEIKPALQKVLLPLGRTRRLKKIWVDFVFLFRGG